MTGRTVGWLLAVAGAYLIGLSASKQRDIVAPVPPATKQLTSPTKPPLRAASPSPPALGALPGPVVTPSDDTVLGELLRKKEPWVWENPQTGVGVTLPALLQAVGTTQRVGLSSQWLFLNLATDGWILLKDNVVVAGIDDPKKAVAKYFSMLADGGVHYSDIGKWRTVTVADRTIQLFAARAGRVADEALMFDAYIWRAPNGLYWSLTVRDPEKTAYGSMTDGLLGEFVASTINFDAEAPATANQTRAGTAEPLPISPSVPTGSNAESSSAPVSVR